MKSICVIISSPTTINIETMEVVSIIGNLINKERYKLLLKAYNGYLGHILAQSFFYSGGEVELVLTNYQSLANNEKLPFIITLQCNDQEVDSYLNKKVDFWIVVKNRQINVSLGNKGIMYQFKDAVDVVNYLNKQAGLFTTYLNE